MSQRRRPSVRERPEWQCQYRGGECTNARATKIDGSLHHLCQDHRLRANWNQRQCQHRRRQRQRRRGMEPTTAPASRRRQGTRDDQLRRLDYDEWLQILDSLDWYDVLTDASSRDDTTSTTTTTISETELFAPIVAQLAGSASHADTALGDDIFYLIGADISAYIPSLSGEDTIADIGSDAS